MKQGLTLLVFLALTWVALSGHYSTEPLILRIGIEIIDFQIRIDEELDAVVGKRIDPFLEVKKFVRDLEAQEKCCVRVADVQR